MKTNVKSLALTALLGLSTIIAGCKNSVSQNTPDNTPDPSQVTTNLVAPCPSNQPTNQSAMPTNSVTQSTNTRAPSTNDYKLNRELHTEIGLFSNKDLPHIMKPIQVNDELIYARQMPTNHPFNTSITNIQVNPAGKLETNVSTAIEALGTFPYIFNYVNNTALYFDSAGRAINLETKGHNYMLLKVKADEIDFDMHGKYAKRWAIPKMSKSTNSLVQLTLTEENMSLADPTISYIHVTPAGNLETNTFFTPRYNGSDKDDYSEMKHLLVRKKGLQYGFHPDGHRSLRGDIYIPVSEEIVSNRIYTLKNQTSVSNATAINSFLKPKKSSPKGRTVGNVSRKVF
ncbi:MAG: hypothetical protein AABX11_07030 [Nanoarchaeota archaeon]